MAQIIKRQTANSETRYDVRTRIDGRVVSRTFRRRKDADSYAATVEADKLRGAVVDPRRARVTVEEWCRSWLALRTDLRPTTRRLYAYLVANYLVPTLGRTELSSGCVEGLSVAAFGLVSCAGFADGTSTCSTAG